MYSEVVFSTLPAKHHTWSDDRKLHTITYLLNDKWSGNTIYLRKGASEDEDI